MKNFHLLLFYSISFSISFSISAQNKDYIGHYETKVKTKVGEIFDYKLILNSDNTFTYHFFRNIGQPQSIDENWYGKGTWKQVKNIIYFYTYGNN